MAGAGKLELEQVYREYGYIVMRRARQILNDDEEAREAVQDVFLALARSLNRFAGASSVATYLYRVTTNQCLNRLRNHRRRERLNEKAAWNGSVSSRAEASVDAQAALRRLPEQLAEIAVYYYVDEMTQDEIAGLLNCSRKTVVKKLTRLHRHIDSWSAARTREVPT